MLPQARNLKSTDHLLANHIEKLAAFLAAIFLFGHEQSERLILGRQDHALTGNKCAGMGRFCRKADFI